MTAADLLILFNLFVLESLLSIDNAAVLAIMVKDLPTKQQGKALKYGIAGAFIFRGVCLLLASVLIKIVWLKIAGGAYLLYLAYRHFIPASKKVEDGNAKKPYRKANRILGAFWSTVLLVEIMDIAFSIDNVFAAVAMTNNIYLIMSGVFIGIVTMRIVAQWFTLLIRKFPSLERSAFIVIALLGLKLITCGIIDYIPSYKHLQSLLNSHTTDLLFSGAMVLIFLFPILFNPQRLR